MPKTLKHRRPDGTFEAVLVGQTGPAGPPGPAGERFEYQQANPATTWVINHNLDAYPNVTVIDTAGTVIVGGVITYSTRNTLTLSFSAGFGGYAYLS